MMSTTVLRITGTSAYPLAAGVLDFFESEVDDIDIVPFVNQVSVASQQDDVTLYDTGPAHYILSVIFIVDTYSTLQRLEDLRNHAAPILLYPSMRDDPDRVFEVLWMDRNNLTEKLKRGFQRLGYAFTATFREPLGEVCRPPGVSS